MFFKPYVVFDAKSTIPVTGLITRPVTPLATPLKIPTAPLFFVYSIGLVTTPVIPYLKP